MPPEPTAMRRQLEALRSLGFGFLEGIETLGGDPAVSEDDPAGAHGEEPRSPLPGPPPERPWQPGTDLGPAERIAALADITTEVAACQACRLCHSRTNVVPGEGDPMARLMFIGEGPGANEDLEGRPFVGKAGELLTKIIEAMQFRRDEVFIANVVKCRPPGNRTPEPDEMATCLPFLRRQLEIIRPRVIVALGKTALMGLLPEHSKSGITKIRGQWLEYQGIALMPTFHPAYLLRSPTKKRFVWEDMQEVMEVFGKKAARYHQTGGG